MIGAVGVAHQGEHALPPGLVHSGRFRRLALLKGAIRDDADDGVQQEELTNGMLRGLFNDTFQQQCCFSLQLGCLATGAFAEVPVGLPESKRMLEMPLALECMPETCGNAPSVANTKEGDRGTRAFGGLVTYECPLLETVCETPAAGHDLPEPATHPSARKGVSDPWPELSSDQRRCCSSQPTDRATNQRPRQQSGAPGRPHDQ